MFVPPQTEEAKKTQSVTSTPQIDAFLSGSWETLCYVPDERVKITFIRCHAIWEGARRRCDRHGVSISIWWSSVLCLYFQPALYLQGSCEIRRDSRLLLSGPLSLRVCTSCWCRGVTAPHNHPAGVWRFRRLFIKEDGKNLCGTHPAGSWFLWESLNISWLKLSWTCMSWQIHGNHIKIRSHNFFVNCPDLPLNKLDWHVNLSFSTKVLNVF